MIGRLTLLGVVLATLPVAVDIPASRDSSHAGGLQVEVAGGVGQFAVVSRGCDGSVYRVAHNQLRSGALVLEQRLPRDYVIGVRAGNVNTTAHQTAMVPEGAPAYQYHDSAFANRYSNPYVNPYVGYDGRWATIGFGALLADRPFRFGEDFSHRINVTGHVGFGEPRRRLTLRWMEDVPLESEGHFSADLGFLRTPSFDAGLFAGMFGPYDGMMVGVRGRVWVTPDAALQIKASTASRQEFGVYGSLTARLPGGH
jgi:hypothetical protein